jgi:hypothetical protein
VPDQGVARRFETVVDNSSRPTGSVPSVLSRPPTSRDEQRAVDLALGVPFVVSPLWPPRSGSRLGRTKVGPTKSYARRSVGIPRSLCNDLGQHLAARASGLGRPLDPGDYIFTAPRGGPLRRDLLLKRFLRPAIEAAGLPRELRLHDLRHTSAALLIELGAHPKAIQERLGHSSITVTMDVYGHLFPSLNEALTERLDDVFRAARSTNSLPKAGVLLTLPQPSSTSTLG